ncbi:MAG: hypothetical protein ACFBSC_12020 [Microcoleaceae cyanobacterium]
MLTGTLPVWTSDKAQKYGASGNLVSEHQWTGTSTAMPDTDREYPITVQESWLGRLFKYFGSDITGSYSHQHVLESMMRSL